MKTQINKLSKDVKKEYLEAIRVYKPKMGEIDNGLIIKNTLAVVTTVEDNHIVIYEIRDGKEKKIQSFPMEKELV